MSNSTTTGILLLCPRCHEAEASIMIHLANGGIFCQECEDEITPNDIDQLRTQINRWGDVMRWMDNRPMIRTIPQ